VGVRLLFLPLGGLPGIHHLTILLPVPSCAGSTWVGGNHSYTYHLLPPPLHFYLGYHSSVQSGAGGSRLGIDSWPFDSFSGHSAAYDILPYLMEVGHSTIYRSLFWSLFYLMRDLCSTTTCSGWDYLPILCHNHRWEPDSTTNLLPPPRGMEDYIPLPPLYHSFLISCTTYILFLPVLRHLGS